MSPISPVHDPFDVALIGSISITDGLQRESGRRAQPADSANVGIGEFGVAILATLIAIAVAHSICCVLFWRCPSQVGGSIVKTVSILMRRLMQFRWSLAVERHTDENVHGLSVSGARAVSSEEHAMVATSHKGAKDSAGMETLISIAIGNHAINGSKAPKARCLIARMVRDGTPFLHYLHDSVASYWTQPGITVLTARV